MKDIVLLYNDCCVYEIVILNYFLKYTNSDVVFVSSGQDKITSMEGYSLNVDASIEDVDLSQVRSFILPGGNIHNVESARVLDVIRRLYDHGAFLAAICAGVDVLNHAGILEGLRSTHSTEEDCVRDGHVITSRANGFIDFAIEVAKALDLFADEKDLQETIAFWKHHQRMQ